MNGLRRRNRNRNRLRHLNHLRRRYIKAAARRKYRGYRMLRAALLLYALLYLAAAGHLKNMILRLYEENTVELQRRGVQDGQDEDGTFLQELYRITFRLKNGELIISHERTESGPGAEE